jgi:hypothetical protein
MGSKRAALAMVDFKKECSQQQPLSSLGHMTMLAEEDQQLEPQQLFLPALASTAEAESWGQHYYWDSAAAISHNVCPETGTRIPSRYVHKMRRQAFNSLAGCAVDNQVLAHTGRDQQFPDYGGDSAVAQGFWFDHGHHHPVGQLVEDATRDSMPQDLWQLGTGGVAAQHHVHGGDAMLAQDMASIDFSNPGDIFQLERAYGYDISDQAAGDYYDQADDAATAYYYARCDYALSSKY